MKLITAGTRSPGAVRRCGSSLSTRGPRRDPACLIRSSRISRDDLSSCPRPHRDRRAARTGPRHRRVMSEQFPGASRSADRRRRDTAPAEPTLTPETRAILAGPARRAFLDADEAVNRAAGLDTLMHSPLPVRPSVESPGKQTRPTQPPPAMSASSKPASPAP